jgi:hypothetical protein
VKKLSSATLAVARHPNLVPRLVLAFVASVLVMLLALMGAGSGPGGMLAFAQETASPTPTGGGSTEPTIRFLNPSEGADPGAGPTETTPAISDKMDRDEQYHVVAWTANLPQNPVVEAYYTPITAAGIELPEITIGPMDLVAGTTDTWEVFWDIPEDIPDGVGRMTVILFSGGLTGFEEVASHELDVRMQNKDDDPPPMGDAEFRAETVEMTWPTQNGELGFFKPKGGAWRTLIDVTVSATFIDATFFYTKSAPGDDPTWVLCGEGPAGSVLSGATQCTLAGRDLPSQVTAVTAVATEVQDCCALVVTEEASDAHRVRPYVQDESTMSMKLLPLSTTDSPGTVHRRVVAPLTTGEPHQCLGFVVEVRDDRQRLVQGANIDIHATGPNDQLQFGDEDRLLDPFAIFAVESGWSSAYKRPDKGTHPGEPGRNCDRGQENEGETYQEKPLEGDQGDHNRPSIPDEKHRESTVGTGLSGGSAGFGRYAFHLFSPNVGFTNVTAWIDEEPLPTEDATREADDDALEEGEVNASVLAQWLPSTMTVSFDPVSDTAAVGSCNQYTVRARSGSVPVPNINVDVHATGPSSELDFCDPDGASARRSPELTGDNHPHRAEDGGEASHPNSDPQQPQTQHTEGETDENGNFVIGITSPVPGDTTLQAWLDGERGSDDDLLGTGEANANATTSWAGSIQDAEVSFLNPSPYGASGTNVSDKADADSRFHIVTRVDAVDVPGVELFIGSSSSGPFTKIGDATRVGNSDTWDFLWDVNVADGSYVLRAQIAGTNRFKDQSITVNSSDPAQPNPNDPPALETLEVTRPTNTQVVSFLNRETEVAGVASAGAEGVDLFYTKVGAKDTPQSGDWISCGFADPGTGGQFSGLCRLQGSDQAGQVTGIAAVTYDCVQPDCNAAPPTGSPAPPRAQGSRESGDAHRVFGQEGRPLLTMEPAEAAAEPDTCQRFALQVRDSSGQAIGNTNVDVHLTGPTDTAHFCDPDTGSTPRRAPDQGGHGAESGETDEGFHSDTTPAQRHTEGETTGSGRFVFGITSADLGDSQLVAWVDSNDDDAQGAEERSDTSLMHWVSDDGGNGGDRCTVKGDSGDNVLRGTPGDDVICGGGGDDRLVGRGGNDILKGGGGRDILRGGAGDDVLRAGGGADRVRAGGGDDRLLGHGGDDFLNGQAGTDRCRGGRGRDTVRNCES